MKVLVVRVTSMGDVVLTLPAITDMTTHVPGIEIDWLIEKPFAAIAQMHPGVRKVFPVQWRKWRKSLWATDTRQAMSDFRHTLRERRYDMVLDFQGQIAKSVILGAMAKGPLHGFAWQGLREPMSSLFYRRKAQVSKSLHLVPRQRALAAQLLGYATPQDAPSYAMRVDPPFWLPPGVQADSAFAAKVSRPFVILIPHASREEKHWPKERWVAIGRDFRARGFEVAVFWGSAAEKELATALAAQFEGVVPPFVTVAQAASILAKAHMVVGLDTGFTHMAAGLERPTVGIYCDFDPKLAGVTGPAYCASVGGIGVYPALEEVRGLIEKGLK